MNARDIEKLARDARLALSEEAGRRIVAVAEAELDKTLAGRGAVEAQPAWRTIMKSPITQLSSAALILIAAALGIMHLATSIDGTGRVWAKAAQKIEQATSAIFREKRIFTCDGVELPLLNSDAICYYSAAHGEREDMYNAEGMLLHQMFWLPHQNARIRIIPPLKQYERAELSEAEQAYFDQPNYQAIMEFFRSENAIPLGRKTIDGREVEGFEIPDSEVAEASPIALDSGMARFWIDVKTYLLVAYEAEVLTRDKYVTILTGGRPVTITVTGYPPEWNVDIDASTFEPNIPPDYTNTGDEPSGAQPSEVAGAVHVLGRDADDEPFELWAEVNPDTGLPTGLYLDRGDGGIVMVSTPKETYSYDRSVRTVRIKDGPGLHWPFRIGHLVEDLRELAKRNDGHVEQTAVFDLQLGRDVTVLAVAFGRVDIKAAIDPQTKLPIRFDSARGLYMGQPFTLKSMEFSYDEQLPEGIFEFAVPEGATVVRRTIGTSDQFLPAEIIRYASKVYTDSTEKTDLWSNTRLTVVDENMKVFGGTVFDVTNDSSRVWTNEISVFNTDSTEMAVFDDAGNRLEVRLVQHRPRVGGRFRVYFKLAGPVPPGERRSFVGWDGYGRPCGKLDGDNRYTLTMENSPGDCLETFILVLAPDVKLREATREPAWREKIVGHTVCSWQDRVSAGQRHRVTVELAKGGSRE
jgi:outer membrane lipoprotein-sorting protein